MARQGDGGNVTVHEHEEHSSEEHKGPETRKHAENDCDK